MCIMDWTSSLPQPSCIAIFNLPGPLPSSVIPLHSGGTFLSSSPALTCACVLLGRYRSIQSLQENFGAWFIRASRKPQTDILIIADLQARLVFRVKSLKDMRL